MAKTAQEGQTSKADEILSVGQELMQTDGYDGFSYRDIADRVGIKSATIHYYFPTKSDLALAVARRYRAEFEETVQGLAVDSADPIEQLAGFAGIFQSTLEDLDRVCLCDMLASEYSSLPDEVRDEVGQFFTDQQAWIGATISSGIESGSIAAVADPDLFAQTFLSALEGAMVMARSMNKPDYLATVASQLLGLLDPNA